MNAQARSPEPKINEKALEAIVKSHYEQTLSEPATARTRAQTAYTVANATAAALIAAGALADITTRPVIVQVVGVLALAAWVVAAAAFMSVSRGVATRVAAVGAETAEAYRVLSAAEFTFKALEHARSVAREIDERLDRAMSVSFAALALTAVAFVTLLVTNAASPSATVTLALTEEGVTSVAAACPDLEGVLEGEIEVSTMKAEYVPVEVEEGSCSDGATTVVVPRAQIQTITVDEDDAGVFPWP